MRTKERKEFKRKIRSGESGSDFNYNAVQRKNFTYVEAWAFLKLPDGSARWYQAPGFSKRMPKDEYSSERGIDIALNRALDEMIDTYEEDVSQCLPF